MGELSYNKILYGIRNEVDLTNDNIVIFRELYTSENSNIPKKVDVVRSDNPDLNQGDIVYDGYRAIAGLPIESPKDLYNAPTFGLDPKKYQIYLVWERPERKIQLVIKIQPM